MFGMGTAMSFNDFYGVIKMPKGVLVGLICQFSIMPILGFSLATLFDFPAEIAAGVVLMVPHLVAWPLMLWHTWLKPILLFLSH